VAQSASSLNEIAAAVKGAVDGAVNVSVVNAGTASSPSWQLVLSGTDSGSDLRFSGLSSTIAGLTIDGTGPDASGNPQSANNLTVANDAQALVDGLLVTRSDNDFSDVIEGVTINLTKADPATTITFTVEADKEAIKARVAEFVGAYNQVVQFINGQSSFSEEDGAGGELFGDNALRTIRRTLTTTLFGQSAAAIQGDTLGYGTLRLVGIETNSDGTLKINDAVFDQKIDANLDAFADLFVDSDGFDNAGALPGTPGYYTDLTADTGLADDLFRAIDQIVLSYQDSSGSFYKGLFEARTQAINDTIALFDDQIAQRELRLEQYEQQLVARFSALEALMAQFQAQSAYLAQNLS
jgi:flagellar hook-associated protein 2